MGNIFFIENYKTKNVIDLSSSGGIVTSYGPKGGDNQKWIKEDSDGNTCELFDSSRRLSLAPQTKVDNSTILFARNETFKWKCSCAIVTNNFGCAINIYDPTTNLYLQDVNGGEISLVNKSENTNDSDIQVWRLRGNLENLD